MLPTPQIRMGAAKIAQPIPPFVSPAEALETPLLSFPTFLQSLAVSSNYLLSTPLARSRLKLVLYSIILHPDSPWRPLFFGDAASADAVEMGDGGLADSMRLAGQASGPYPDIEDDWSLAKLQGDQGGEYSEGRRGMICGHVFRAGESVYRCRDCSLDATCVLCAKCFRGSSHAALGHDVTLSIHAGISAGCCDCGDVEALKVGGISDCKHHAAREGDTGTRGVDEDVEGLQAALGERLGFIIDWMLSVLETSPEEMLAPTSVEDIVGDGSPPPPRPPLVFHADSSSSLPSSYIPSSDTAPSSSPPPSFSSSTSRGKARASSPPPPTPSTGPWSVVLWNDEKHSFAQVIDQVSRATGVSRAEAAQIAQRVDIYGRDIIYISTDPTRLLQVSRRIANIDLAVTVRPAEDTFYEQVAGEIIHFMKDLCVARIRGQGGALSATLAKVLVERTDMSKPSRFQQLLSIDGRLWKESRKGLAELYVTLLGVSPAIKTELSVQFAQIYANVAESYLLTDREPENSIVSFGVQVFTVPSVSAFLVSEHRFLAGLISILFSFFTEQLEAVDRKRLVLPPNPTIRRIDPESPAFKQKRYFQIFGDLNHLIASPSVHRLICDSTDLIENFSAFLDLFTSMNPNTRAISTHVEYESDTWVTAFNVTIQLGKICRSFGEAYRQATPLQLARALSVLLARMSGSRASIHSVLFGGAVYQLIDFRVQDLPVSFHHPLAWLFAEMVKNVEALDPAALKTIGVADLSDIALGRAGQLHFLAAMDHPLRVVVLVAQIRAGLWVRNGFGMRAQQLHYKEYSLRENTFDQDIFFLQASLVILDPSLVLVAILDRFDVTEWLLGADSHGTYEPAQLFAVVEEMLYTVILLLSDDTYAAGLAPEVCIRKELIHNLCLGPSVYSDLMRRVSERFSDDPTLDRVLGEVAQFKPPSGVSDQGTYTLRPEFFAEVDPYFARYSRNQREEAEKVVREHLKKESPNVEPVIVPKSLHITAGPFASLSKAFDSHVLHQIIYYCMQHGRSRGVLFSEVLVDEALHLSMLALVQQSHAFVKFALEEVFDVNTDAPTLVHLLVRVEEDDRIKSLRHKARWCLDRLQELVGPAVAALRKVEDTVAPAIALDANRLAAKARQAAIMAQFAQAQKAFLDSAENIDDEEDGDDEEMEGDNSVGVSLGSCIVCQDELNETKPFGSLALIQTSSIMRYTPARENSTYQSQVLSTPSDLDRDATETRRARFGDNDDDTLPQGFPPSSTNTGLHASACGHMMHQSCFETYYKSIEQRHHVQPTRCHPENTGRGEFTCPLCKSLGNVLLPAFLDTPTDEINGRDLDDWARTVMDPVANALEMQFLPDEVPIVLRHAATFHDTKLFGHITPWRIDSSVTSGRPEFGSGNRLMAAQLLQVASALVLESSADEPVSLTSSLVGYTLAVTEIGSRGQAEAAESIPDPSLRMLSSLLALLRDLATFDMGTTKLTALVVLPHIGGIFGSALPQGDEKFGEPINTLLEVAAAVPASFYQAAAFCYYTELVEVFSGYRHLLDRSNETVAFEGKATDAELTDYAALAQLKRFVRHSDEPGPDDLTLGKALHAYSLPFLRRASILRRVLFGPSTHSSSAGSEMSRLLGVLRIPHPAIALCQDATGSASIQAHINACVAQRYPSPPSSSDPTSFDPRSVRRPLEHPAIYELVGLPHQLDSLAAESLERKCERCKQVPAEPAMCLFCGVIVCNQSFCCMDGEEEAQQGECNMHMWTCGGAVSIYFLIKKNVVLYLYTDKGTFSTPPYLDSHGEVDLGGRRGRNQFPQFLHQGRYDEIRKAWLSHGIPTFVARKLEASTDHGGWETM